MCVSESFLQRPGIVGGDSLRRHKIKQNLEDVRLLPRVEEEEEEEVIQRGQR